MKGFRGNRSSGAGDDDAHDEQHSSSMADVGAVRRRQIRTAVIFGTGTLVVVFLGLKFTSGNSTAQTEVKKNDIVVKAVKVPGELVTAEQLWLDKGVNNLAKVERNQADVVKRVDDYEQRIKQLESMVRELSTTKPTEPPVGKKGSDKTSDAGRLFNVPVPTLKDGFDRQNIALDTTARGSAAIPATTPTVGGSTLKVPQQGGVIPVSQNTPISPGGGTTFRTATGSQSTPRETGIMVVTIGDGSSGGPNKGDGPKFIEKYVPIGFTKAVILGGVDAPTGRVTSDPLPVLLQTRENQFAPNNWRRELKKCFVIAAANGDLSAERAYMRMERMSCVTRSGEIIEAKASGYISGEDGKAGVRGRIVDKQGQLLARSFMSGLFAGFGDAAQRSYTNIATSPLGTVESVNSDDVAKRGLLKGFSTSMDRISDFYLKLAQDMFPVVEVAAGRTVNIVFTSALEFGYPDGTTPASVAPVAQTVEGGSAAIRMNEQRSRERESERLEEFLQTAGKKP